MYRNFRPYRSPPVTAWLERMPAAASTARSSPAVLPQKPPLPCPVLARRRALKRKIPRTRKAVKNGTHRLPQTSVPRESHWIQPAARRSLASVMRLSWARSSMFRFFQQIRSQTHQDASARKSSTRTQRGPERNRGMNMAI